MTSQQTSVETVACDAPADEEWSSAKLPPRRRARALVLQALFELDATQHKVEDVLQALLQDGPVESAGEEFIRGLVNGVYERCPELDVRIQEFAPAWPINQLSLVDRSLLRLAVYELTVARSLSPKVVINEAVELAKLFGGESSPRFVNGVLGSLQDATVREQQA